MSIELPPIPPLPGAESTPAEWDVYLRIVALHNSAASTAAINAQTAQMALMTAAAERNAALMQQLLDQEPVPAPVAGGDASRAAVIALLGETGERTPADVATAALARMGAADRVLGGEAPAP